MVNNPEMSEEKAGYLFDSLMMQVANSDKVKALSNSALCEDLLEKVWAHLDIHSYESALVEEAYERLKALDRDNSMKGVIMQMNDHNKREAE